MALVAAGSSLGWGSSPSGCPVRRFTPRGRGLPKAAAPKTYQVKPCVTPKEICEAAVGSGPEDEPLGFGVGGGYDPLAFQLAEVLED